VIFLSENFPKSQGKGENYRQASRTTKTWVLHFVRKSALLVKARGMAGGT
jgi:hypothetical protein